MLRLLRLSVTALCLVFAVFVTGCGANSGVTPPPVPATMQAPPVTLDGNWLLAGARTPATYPLLSTALFVSGTQITGRYALEIECSPTSHLSAALSIAGTIANDGTFTASSGTVGAGTPGSFAFTVTGSSPTAAAPTVWTGNYSMSATLSAPGTSAGTTCTYTHTGPFTAVPISALTGVYTGPASKGTFGTPFGANATVQIQVTQGYPALVTRGTTTEYYIPLSGTIAFTNSTCAASGTTAGTLASSEISGDSFVLRFTMTDGSQLTVTGNLTDPSAASLDASLIDSPTSPCGPAPSLTTLVRR